MESNTAVNAIHRNHLKLDNALTYDRGGAAQFMEPAARVAIRELASRIAPLMKAADDRGLLGAKEGVATAAHAQTKSTLKRLRGAVVSNFEVMPPELERLRGLQLGKGEAEDVLILRAVVDVLKTQPGFVFPPRLTAADAEAVIQAHEAAFGDWKGAKRRAADAAAELVLLRPQVKRLWEQHHLRDWVKAHIRGTEEQQKWGLSPKKRVRRASEEDVKVPEEEVTTTVTQPATATTRSGGSISMPKALDGKTPVSSNVGMTVTPAFKGVTPPVKHGVNGSNGHDVGAPLSCSPAVTQPSSSVPGP